MRCKARLGFGVVVRKLAEEFETIAELVVERAEEIIAFGVRGNQLEPWRVEIKPQVAGNTARVEVEPRIAGRYTAAKALRLEVKTAAAIGNGVATLRYLDTGEARAVGPETAVRRSGTIDTKRCQARVVAC